VSEGLIDAIGDEEAAVAWLEAEKKIAADTAVIDWTPDEGLASNPFDSSIAGPFIDMLGLSAIRQMGEAAKLDGLLVLWHPSF
jgi:protease-4